jgi:hypothetical protein
MKQHLPFATGSILSSLLLTGSLLAEPELRFDLPNEQMEVSTEAHHGYELFRSTDLSAWTSMGAFKGDGSVQRMAMHEADPGQTSVYYQLNKRNHFIKKGVGQSIRVEEKVPNGQPIVDTIAAMNMTWFYNWGLEPRYAYDIPEGLEFVPMFWGYQESYGPLAAIQEQLDRIAADESITHLLGFNEPDNLQQANMTVEAALDLWPMLESTGKRLGSPAPGGRNNALYDGRWLDRFMQGVAERGYRVDFICLHIYQESFDVQYLIEYCEQAYAKYGLPIWITEWSLVNWNGASPPDHIQARYLEEAIKALETLPYVERHAWFALNSYREQNQTENWDMGLVDFDEVFVGRDPETGRRLFELELELTVVGETMRDVLKDGLPDDYVIPEPEPLVPGVNLLSNGGFEAGLKNWTIWSEDDLATWTVSDESHESPNSARVTASSDYFTTFRQNVFLSEGGAYITRFYLKHAGTFQRVLLQMYVNGEWRINYDVEIGETFTETTTLPLYLNAGDEAELRFLFKGHADTEIFLDDVFFGLPAE